MKTLVVGVSLGARRYANLALQQLADAGHEVAGLGLRAGEESGAPVFAAPIDRAEPFYSGIDTVTLYINPQRQAAMIDDLLALKPRRIIFNPGTENTTFQDRAEAAGIEAVVGCTLVMLSIGTYEQ